MKHIVFLLSLLAACAPREANQEKAEKLVIADVTAQGMGLVEGVEVLSMEAVDDSTYIVLYAFPDPLRAGHRWEVARTYFFDSAIETVKKTAR